MEPKVIKQLREDLGLSRAALAAFLGVVEITVLRWENGTGSTPHGLPMVVLQTLARAVEKVGREPVARLVRHGLHEHGEALRLLLTLAQEQPRRR